MYPVLLGAGRFQNFQLQYMYKDWVTERLEIVKGLSHETDCRYKRSTYLR